MQNKRKFHSKNMSFFEYYSKKIWLFFIFLIRIVDFNELNRRLYLLKKHKKNKEYRLGIAYNLFDGEELLEDSIKSVRAVASYIVVVYQKVSNYKVRANSDLLPLLNDLKKRGLIDELYEYEPKFNNKDLWFNEKKKRDIGLSLVKKAKCNYFLSMDVDEFYKTEQLSNALEFIVKENIYCSAVSIIEYIKKPIYQLVNGYTFSPVTNKQDYNYYVPFIMKVHKYKKQFHSSYDFPCLVDPTRGLNCKEKFYLFSRHIIAMHHMSTIRKDLRRKYESSNLQRGNIEEIKNIEQKILKFEYQKNLIELSNFDGVMVRIVPNYFDINLK